MEKHVILGEDSFTIRLRWDNIENKWGEGKSKSNYEQFRISDRLRQQWIHDIKILKKLNNYCTRLNSLVSAWYSPIKTSPALKWYDFFWNSHKLNQTVAWSIFKILKLNAWRIVN